MDRVQTKQHMRRIGILMIAIAVMVAFTPIFGGQAYGKTIKLSSKSVHMAKGTTYKLKVKGTRAKVKWYSSNKKIATVSKGKIKAKKVGTTTITAKVKGKKLKCKVTVETKAVNKARKLKDYVIKYGKYDKKAKTYTLKKEWVDDESNMMKAALIAYKGKNKMTFECAWYPDAPANTNRYTMNINLISGKSSVKNGTVKYYWSDAYEDYHDIDMNGKITTKFDGNTKGLTPTMWAETHQTDYETGVTETETVTGAAELKAHYDLLKHNTNTAFGHWNEMFKSKKGLKKAGITMKSIGFSKWSVK